MAHNFFLDTEPKLWYNSFNNLREGEIMVKVQNKRNTDSEVNDYYATDPKALENLLGLETFKSPILEPCCGEGHLSEVLKDAGYEVWSSDIIDRGYGAVRDVKEYMQWDGDIITNPPYKQAQEIIEHCIDIVPDGAEVVMFLKLLFLESKKRKIFFEKYPPRRIWVSSSRISCGKNGVFLKGSSAVCYAWFVWEKGYQGETIINWFN